MVLQGRSKIMLDKILLLAYDNCVMGKDGTKKPDALIEALRKIKEEGNISIRDLAKEMGVHYLTVFRWFHGTLPSNLSRRVIKRFIAERL